MELERRRESIVEIFERWPAPSYDLDRIFPDLMTFFGLVMPAAYDDENGHVVRNDSILNTQVSVDTKSPGVLRAMIDPFPGDDLAGVSLPRLRRAIHKVPSGRLQKRVLELYEIGRPHLQSLGLGLVPAGSACLSKAYTGNSSPEKRHLVLSLARDAGWFPLTVDEPFTDLYNRLVPVFGAVEGVGISFRDDEVVGTTLYLRSLLPWSYLGTQKFLSYIGIRPPGCLRQLAMVFSGQTPQTVWWSFESDGSGHLVDFKIEVIAEQLFSRRGLEKYGREFGLEVDPILELSKLIREGGFSRHDPAVPRIISLRFVDGDLVSLAAYFQLSIYP